MGIDLEDPSYGPLVMDRTEGLVYRRRPDETLEYLGPVMDASLAPDDLLDEWTALYLWWLQAGGYGRACEAEAYRSYYDRFSIVRMN